jgi:dTDP-4-amino-4,6-dideoxygalactose transaminase
MTIEHAFPPPAIPKDPVLSWRALFGRKNTKMASFMSLGHLQFLTSGRMGIGNALRLMGVRPGDRVLVPAYHCNAMIEPVVWLGAIPVFYRISADAGVDLDDVARLLREGGASAMLVTHYFGFPQDNQAISGFCQAHAIPFVEDCAHAFFGEVAGKPIGSFGQYAIASPWKFFAIYDGGCIAMRGSGGTCLCLQRPSISFQFKSAINALEAAFHYRRLCIVRHIAKPLLWLKDAIWSRIKHAAGPRVNSLSAAPNSAEGGTSFEPFWLDKRMSLASRLLMHGSDFGRIIALRRRNYQRFLNACIDIPGCHPLFPVLPETVVPYAFPLVIDEPERIFAPLKQAGVPIIRFGEVLWPGVDASVCPISVEFSRKVFQFPCHQELDETELEWMIATIRSTLVSAQAVNCTPSGTPA